MLLLSQILPRVATLRPETTALLHEDGSSMTYAILYEQASRLANAFSHMGVQAGDRVALVGNPCFDLILAEHAAVAIGAIPFAVNTSLALPEMQDVLQDGDPVLVVCDAAHIKIVEKLHVPGARNLVACSPAGPYAVVADLIRTYEPCGVWHEGHPDDVTLIIYTGGTTGRPRGVMHTNRSMMSWTGMNPKQLAAAPGDKAILVYLAHITGQGTMWTRTVSAGCLVTANTYPVRASDALRLVDSLKVNYLPLGGQLLHDFVTLPDVEAHDLSSVTLVTHGGSPTSRHVLMKSLQVFPSAMIGELYGTTEAGLFISGHFANVYARRESPLDRLDSVGSPAFLASVGQTPYEVKILDDDGQEVPPHTTGEVVCKGELMMKGYWRNPEATADAIRDGWLHLGDMGWMDEEGYLYLCDRKKDMIIVRGLNVYSIEVENILHGHPAISEAAVISTPLAEEGEEVTAVITLKPGHSLTLEELRQYCGGRIADYKIPTRLHVVGAIPRTAVDKVDKAAIREPFWQGYSRRIR